METGNKMVDPRFRPECLNRLNIILNKKLNNAPNLVYREKYQKQIDSV